MSVYYNEFDPFAAAWLRELIAAGELPDGEIDTRDIRDVQPDDLRGFVQCHFFAGIGGWPYALRLAGWPDDRPVWTGSCPCQPFSPAGRGHGEKDARHLWPVWFPLIQECRPSELLGEQTTGAAGYSWLDAVLSDLEDETYAVAAADLCAASVGAPHNRSRLWWCATHPDCSGGERHPFSDGLGGHGPWGPRGQANLRDISVHPLIDGPCWPQPLVRVVDDGISGPMVRRCQKGFGNAIVPQVAAAFISAYLDISR